MGPGNLHGNAPGRNDKIPIVRGVLQSVPVVCALGALWAQSFNPDTFVGARARYWAFQKVVRPAPPAPGNPIDAFIQDGLRKKQLTPSKPLDRAPLLRRVTYDLTGLPPTPAEIEAFLKDKSPDAYEKVVDRLLASPQYGERWARHWLDLVRYAETFGHEFDFEIADAWRYRDYVVRAFNADLPY